MPHFSEEESSDEEGRSSQSPADLQLLQFSPILNFFFLEKMLKTVINRGLNLTLWSVNIYDISAECNSKIRMF